MTVDCMACLVALARGLPEGGTHVDRHGITHATLRTQYLDVFTCMTKFDPDSPGRALIDWRRTKPVIDDR